jgi:hypothetical protein
MLVHDHQYARLNVRELHHRALDIELGDQVLLLRSERSQEEKKPFSEMVICAGVRVG